LGHWGERPQGGPQGLPRAQERNLS
jgi:hypothetical protein